MSNSNAKRTQELPQKKIQKINKVYDNVEFSQPASLFHVCASCIVFSKADSTFYHPHVTKT